MWLLRKDSHAHYEQLMRPHLKRLYQLAYRYTRQQDDAEDLVQDLLLKLYPRLQELQAIDKLGPWLARVLFRLFVDHARHDRRSPIDFTVEDSAIYETHEIQQAGPPAVVNTQLTHELLDAALNRLKQEDRLLVLMHDVEGYTLQEIQDIVDAPIGTLKSRLSRSRKKLRDIITGMEPNPV